MVNGGNGADKFWEHGVRKIPSTTVLPKIQTNGLQSIELTSDENDLLK